MVPPHRSVLRGTAVAVATLALGIAVAGCGSDDGGPSASATTRAAPTTTAPGATTTAPRTTTGEAPSTGTTEATPPRGQALTPEREKKVFPNVLPLRKVPQERDRAADQATAKVAERWFDLVRRGEDDQAADLMADGARFSNFDILLVPNRAARVAVADSLPCGAQPTDVGGARDGYVVLTLKLVDKAGEPPCDGAGNPVAVALHVTDGKIDDWVRVLAPDAPINQGTPV